MKNPKILLLFGFLFLTLISYVYYKQSVNFAYVDEVNNIAAGYFMLQGRELYKEIFFNHQILGGYASYAVQALLHPQSLYQLIVYHRVTVIGFSFLCGLALVWRFRLMGLGIVMLYEIIKFYVFGHLFLAEAFVVYPLVYLFCVCWYRFVAQRSIGRFDLTVSTLAVFFVVFMREPFIPLAVLLYGIILWKSKRREAAVSLLFFVVTSAVLIFTSSWQEYYTQVVTANFQTIIPSEQALHETGGYRYLKMAFYPVYILLAPQKGYFGVVSSWIAVLFLVCIGLLVFKFKKYWIVLSVVFVLVLANIRFVPPANVFYSAFHMTVWYGLVIAFICLCLEYLFSIKHKKLYMVLLGGYVGLVAVAFFLPGSVVFEKVDTQKAFNENYGHYYAAGETIRRLSQPDDQVFVDMWDMLVYWQAGRESAYHYSIFLPIMLSLPQYSDARSEMFERNPPDFYYVGCGSDEYFSGFLTPDVAQKYTQLKSRGKSSCLYIKNEKLDTIAPASLESIKTLGYEL